MSVLSTTDLRLVFRSLARNPLFALLVAATLAVGVGATAATFTYVGMFVWDNVIPDPDSVFEIRYTFANEPLPQPMSYLDFQDFRREGAAIGEVTAWWIWGQGVRVDDGTAAWAWGHAVSDGYLETLRARPAAGRLFLPDDHRAGAPRAVVLSHRFWRRHYDLAPEAVGKVLEVGGQAYTIVGVTREGFIGTGVPADLYIPIQYTRDGAPEWEAANRNPSQIWSGRVWVMARLANGTSREEAQNRFRALALDLDHRRPLEDRNRELEFGGYVDPNQQLRLQGALRLLGGAGLLLVLANVNVASLLVARYLQRRRDVSILSALGASVGRITAQLAIEALALSLAGGLLGIALSRALVSMLRRIMITANPVDMGRWGEGAEGSILQLDWRVVAFALLSSLLTTLIFGLLPAIHAARADLKTGLRTMTAGADRGQGKARRALVMAQVALALILVVAAGLLIRSSHNVWRVNPGFETRSLAIATIGLAHGGGDEREARAAFEQVREHAAAIAGVEDATLTDPVPLWGWRSAGIASPVNGEKVEVVQQVVGPRYFETVRQPLLRGRSLGTGDTAEAPLVAVVNQELAHRFWPDSDPVGQTLPLEIPRLGVAGRATIVGVAADARQDLKQDARPQLYLAGGQVKRTRMSVLARTGPPPATMLANLERDLERVHPALAIVNVATFDRHIANGLYDERQSALLGGVTATLGLLLAAAGIWSVLTFVVRARRREIAVRVALGASRRDVVARLLREAGTPVALGTLIGVGGAVASSRLLRAQLFGVDPLDPTTLVAAAAVVVVCAALAALGPSLRASRIDPMTILRED